MAVSIERLEEVGRTFVGIFERRDPEVMRDLYSEDAVFISPNPPLISAEFGTVLRGRDEILRYLEASLALVPPSGVPTVAMLTGIDMVIWVYEAGPRMMADVILFGDDGLITTHRVTAMPSQ